VAVPRRTSQRVTLLMLVLASVTVLALDYHGSVSRGINHVRNGARDALQPFQRGIAAALHPIGDVFAGAAHYGQLQEQNARLRSELGNAQRELEAESEASASSTATLALEHLSYLAGLSGTLAEVISAPSSNFEDTIELDKGTDQGVGAGMPVVSGRGLVGTVTSASSDTAIVRLVTDARSKVYVSVAGSTAVWRSTGAGLNRPLSVGEISSGATSVRPGALVTTSGLDNGKYPAGIPVGRVATVHGGISPTLSTTPIVDVNSLEYVSVLDWLPPA